MAGLHGRLCISGRVGRQPEFSRTDQLVQWDAAEPRGGRAGARQALPARSTASRASAHFTEWSGLAKPHAKALWGRAARRAAARTEGRAPARARRSAAPAPRPRGVRADAAWRKQVWAASGGSGVVTRTARPSRCGGRASRARRSRSRSTAATSTCRSGRPARPAPGLFDGVRDLRSTARGPCVASRSSPRPAATGRPRSGGRSPPASACGSSSSTRSCTARTGPRRRRRASRRSLQPILEQDGWVIDGDLHRARSARS